MRHIYKTYTWLSGEDTAAHLRTVNCDITPKLSSAYATYRVYISNIHHIIDWGEHGGGIGRVWYMLSIYICIVYRAVTLYIYIVLDYNSQSYIKLAYTLNMQLHIHLCFPPITVVAMRAIVIISIYCAYAIP